MPENNKNTNALTAALVPGILSGVIVVIMSVSLAALVFSGRLAGHIADGIALAINTAIIAGLGIAFFSSCKPVISIVDEDTAPVFALLASFVVAALPVTATGDQLFITAVAAIVFTTMIGGIGLFLLGVFRFGNFIQFLPHSVMGGYFAAVGWLLVIGGLKVSSGLTLSSWDAVQALVDEERLVRWLPAIAISLILFGLRKRVSSTVLMPATVFAALVVWHAVQAYLGVSPTDAMRDNLLIGPFGDESARLLKPMAGIDFDIVNWGALFSNVGTVASVFLIAVMSMMLSISGLGFLTRTEPDMNSELKVAGLANMASGFGGGMIGLP
ncbi:MAG: SulP family inorganic anion transporter, partial [Woeseiaceae bacterium]|nr:SulP family inorganic anion transporter [Woeseiaceae bacterium]